MFGSQILEIAIGMVFVYLSLSLVCSGINEWIANIFQLRAELLEKWLQEQLTKQQTGDALPGATDNDYLTKFKEHPLIKALYQQAPSSNKPPANRLMGVLFRASRKPSYIPSRTFALAMLDMVAPVDRDTGSRTLTTVGTPLDQTMQALIDDAGTDAETIRQNIEKWFNDAMERLSGWYKQQMKLIILGLAIAVTLLLNVNSIQIFNSLYHDGTVRAAVVAAAQQAAQQPAPPDTQSPVTKITEIQSELEQLKIPFGWTDPKVRPDINNPESILLALLGWALTALAVAQGAPFWFDVLNRLVNVRTSGARPPTTPETETVRPQVIVKPMPQVEPLKR